MMSSALKKYETPGYIYKIIDIDETKTYIGITFNTLSKRFYENKSRYKNGTYEKNTSFDKFGVDNCKVILVDTLHLPCTKQELLKLEQVWIVKTDCVNKFSSYLSNEQKKENKRS